MWVWDTNDPWKQQQEKVLKLFLFLYKYTEQLVCKQQLGKA